MGKEIDITGNKYAHLTAIKKASNAKWTFLCDCGTEKDIAKRHVLSGKTRSCGCAYRDKNIKHGLCRTPIYMAWENMKKRCLVETNVSFKNYGGRGITVCDEWLSFDSFYADMGESFFDGAQMDRIDNNGNYEPANCRWVTREENCQNRRNTKLNQESVKVIKYFIKNTDVSLSKLARVHKVSIQVISHIRNGKTWKNITID